jgi:hypothetical protein
MCICSHGSDRHYLDYAGVGVCGGILGKCLESGCACLIYVQSSAITHAIPTTITPAWSRLS